MGVLKRFLSSPDHYPTWLICLRTPDEEPASEVLLTQKLKQKMGRMTLVTDPDLNYVRFLKIFRSSERQSEVNSLQRGLGP